MGAGASNMSPGQGLNLVNVMNTGSSAFMTPDSFVQAATTNNPLISLARNQSVSQLNSIGQAIQRSLFELGTDSSGSLGSDAKYQVVEKSQIVNEYKALLGQVQQYTAVAPSLELGELNNKIAELRGKMIKLDERKRKLVYQNPLGHNSLFATTVGAMNYYLVWILYGAGPFFAIVILLNALCLSPSPRVPESSLGFYIYRIFYSFLAYLFYPIFLLYGSINPPVFSAWFPIWGRDDIPIGGILIYKKPNPATDNPIILERGRVLLRFISLVLLISFLYTFIFFDEISPLSK
jgi:hypothetical protein